MMLMMILLAILKIMCVYQMMKLIKLQCGTVILLRWLSFVTLVAQGH